MKRVASVIFMLLCVAAFKFCVFELRKSSGKPLEGTMWKLIYMPGIPDSVRMGKTDYFTITLDEKTGIASGRTHCNRFTGRYRTKKSMLEFGAMGLTYLICPDMSSERRFIDMLDSVDRFETRGRDLRLYCGERELALFREKLDRKDIYLHGRAR